jgi:Uma2 family endonuclease
VDGELLVTSSPSGIHQRAVREIMLALAPYLDLTGLGEVLASPSDVELEPETLVQPDVYVIPPEEGMRLLSNEPARILLLAIEVISPSSSRHDRGRKRLHFQRNVPEYWIVDLDARLVERWLPGDERPEILRQKVEWLPAGAATPFEMQLAPFFAKIFGETA